MNTSEKEVSMWSVLASRQLACLERAGRKSTNSISDGIWTSVSHYRLEFYWRIVPIMTPGGVTMRIYRVWASNWSAELGGYIQTRRGTLPVTILSGKLYRILRVGEALGQVTMYGGEILGIFHLVRTPATNHREPKLRQHLMNRFRVWTVADLSVVYHW